MEENTCEAILPHINGNVVRKEEKTRAVDVVEALAHGAPDCTVNNPVQVVHGGRKL